MATKKTAKKDEIKEEVKPAEPADTEQTEKLPQSFAELQAMIAAAVAKAMAETAAKPAEAAAAPARERVMLLWMAPVAEDNVQEFGPQGRFGRIVGPYGSLYVPKDDFPQILDGITRMFLARRWLIVVSGLDENERDAFGVNYREGELIDKQAFQRLAEQGMKLLEIYPALCPGHRKIVAARVYEAWKGGNKAVTRGLVKELNKLCKKIDPDEHTFKAIMEEMNVAELDEE
jgi:hypothetical protein